MKNVLEVLLRTRRTRVQTRTWPMGAELSVRFRLCSLLVQFTFAISLGLMNALEPVGRTLVQYTVPIRPAWQCGG